MLKASEGLYPKGMSLVSLLGDCQATQPQHVLNESFLVDFAYSSCCILWLAAMLKLVVALPELGTRYFGKESRTPVEGFLILWPQ